MTRSSADSHRKSTHSSQFQCRCGLRSRSPGSGDVARALRIDCPGLLLPNIRWPAVKLMPSSLRGEDSCRAIRRGRLARALPRRRRRDEGAERGCGHIERYLAEARPSARHSPASTSRPSQWGSKTQVIMLAAGDSWLERRAILLQLGPPN
jgi:hypothetical protein